MEKVKLIRGRPIYLYKGSQYIEKPEKTIVRKMRYSKDDGITYIYLKRVSHLYEILSILILIGLVLYNQTITHGLQMAVRYNSLVNYYHGMLQVNIHAEVTNPIEIRYTIDEYSGVLQPGESLISLYIDNPKNRYTVIFSYDTLLGERSFDVEFTVINRDLKGEDYEE